MSGRLKPSNMGLEPLVGCGKRRAAPRRQGSALCWTRFFSPGNVKKLGETCPKDLKRPERGLRLRWGQMRPPPERPREGLLESERFLRSQVSAPTPCHPRPGTWRAGPAGPSLGQRAWQVPRAGRSAAPAGRPAQPVHLCRSAGEAQGEGLLSVGGALGGEARRVIVSWASLGEETSG